MLFQHHRGHTLFCSYLPHIQHYSSGSSRSPHRMCTSLLHTSDRFAHLVHRCQQDRRHTRFREYWVEYRAHTSDNFGLTRSSMFHRHKGDRIYHRYYMFQRGRRHRYYFSLETSQDYRRGVFWCILPLMRRSNPGSRISEK